MRVGGDPRRADLAGSLLFDPPVSPHLAAEAAGDDDSTSQESRAPRTAPEGPLDCRGRRRSLVPINETQTMLDLIVQLTCRWWSRSRTALGTINHTSLTVHALRRGSRKSKAW